MKRHTPSEIALVVSLAAASALMAQAPTDDVDAVTGTPAVRLHQSGAVQYLSGGVGDPERQAMLAQHHGEFPLQILFSGKAGEYGVADQVRVVGRAGEVARIANAGPLLMLDLPPGRYTIEATFAGHTQARSVSVGRGVQTMHWASDIVSDN